jgi:hypothetical protein
MTTLNVSTAHPSKFKLVFPYMEFLGTRERGEYFNLWCSEVNLPGIKLGIDKVVNQLYTDSQPDGMITFGDLEVTFSIDELFENYGFIYNWMMYINNPERLKVNNPLIDATLHVYSNNNNPKLKFTIKDINPYSLSDIKFSTKTSDVKDMEAKVVFSISYFQFTGAE